MPEFTTRQSSPSPTTPVANGSAAGVGDSSASPRRSLASSSPTAVLGTLERPETTEPIRIEPSYAIALTLVHLVAVVPFLPGLFTYLFSWTGLVVGIMGHFVFGMMGITIGYHRLLTHRGFSCPKWFEHFLAILGICNLQDSPARWVAIHRQHHANSDEQPDPHSPLVGLFWGHMGWLFVKNRDHMGVSQFEKYVRDLLKDPFYLRLERNSLWLGVYLLHALTFFVVGWVVGWLMYGDFSEALRFGLSIFFWGVVVRTVFVLHGTWAVNSLSHIWGYRNYETSDNSRNNWLVALIAHGEGWHNNHHADQRAASHGHRKWEFDMSWWIIVGLEKLGLAKNLVRPRCWNSAGTAK